MDAQCLLMFYQNQKLNDEVITRICTDIIGRQRIISATFESSPSSMLPIGSPKAAFVTFSQGLKQAMASTVAVDALSGTSPSNFAGILQSLPMNPQAIGTAWLISSAVFTTYSTTTFLKFNSNTADSTEAMKGGKSKRQFSRSITPAKVAKQVLPVLSRPTLLTLFRFGGSLLLGLLAHPDLAIMHRIRETLQSVPDFALPAAFLFTANFANSISLNRIGISLTYTSKCGIPLITVLLTILLDGTKALPNTLALASLLPIAIGIAAASWNSPTFETIGFLAAVTSATAQSALNVTSKRAMMKTGVTGSAAQRVMVAVGLVITIVVTLTQVLTTRYSKDSSTSDDNAVVQAESGPPAWLTAFAASSYHLEYMLSFMFVRLVEPITYGTCDAIRRLAIIISGRGFFGGPPLTRYNIIGVALALLGALGFSVANSL
jgi:hypothetical protein